MMILSVDLIKQNSRIDSEEEDEMIEQIGESAEEIALSIMQRDWTSIYDQYGKIPASITRACLILADNLYNHRGASQPQAIYNIPYSVDALLKPYIILV